MSEGTGYKAKYDYVDLMVEERGGNWVVSLTDNRHGDKILHDEQFPSAEEAQHAALALAKHHINVAHNDTLLYQTRLTWLPC